MRRVSRSFRRVIETGILDWRSACPLSLSLSLPSSSFSIGGIRIIESCPTFSVEITRDIPEGRSGGRGWQIWVPCQWTICPHHRRHNTQTIRRGREESTVTSLDVLHFACDREPVRCSEGSCSKKENKESCYYAKIKCSYDFAKSHHLPSLMLNRRHTLCDSTRPRASAC